MEATEGYETRASISQRLLWMIKQYRGDYGALCCPVVCRITGELDVDLLQSATNELSRRHDALRTTVHGRGAGLTQRIHPPREEPIDHADLSGSAHPEAAAEAALRVELSCPLDPREWPVRARLWRLAAGRHLFCLNVHHFVTDAWSTGVLLRDLCALYDRAAGGTPALPPAGWSPAKFVQWQRDLLAGDRMRAHRAYWRRQLSGARLPKLASAPPRPGETGRQSHVVDVAASVVAGLRALARTERTTLFTVLLALFTAQLHRTTGAEDVAIASMFSNRTRTELRDSVGLIAGMVLLRTQVDPGAGFTALVQACHRTVVGGVTHSELPYQLLPSNLVDAGGGRADDVMFNVMADTQHVRTSAGLRFELVVPTDIGSRFPFELSLVPIGHSGLRAVLFRAPDRLDVTAGTRFVEQFAELAAAAVGNPAQRLRSLLTTLPVA